MELVKLVLKAEVKDSEVEKTLIGLTALLNKLIEKFPNEVNKTYLQEFIDDLYELDSYNDLSSEEQEDTEELWMEIFDDEIFAPWAGEGNKKLFNVNNFLKIFYDDPRELELINKINQMDFLEEWEQTEDYKVQGFSCEKVTKKTADYFDEGDGMGRGNIMTTKKIFYKYTNQETGEVYKNSKGHDLFAEEFQTYDKWRERHIWKVKKEEIAKLPSVEYYI